MTVKSCVTSLAVLALLSLIAVAVDGGFDHEQVAWVSESELARDDTAVPNKKGDLKKMAWCFLIVISYVCPLAFSLIECMHNAGIRSEDTDKMDDSHNDVFKIDVGSDSRSLSPGVALKAVHATIHCFANGTNNTGCCTDADKPRDMNKCLMFCDDSAPEKYQLIGLKRLLSDCSTEAINIAIGCHIYRYTGSITDPPPQG